MLSMGSPNCDILPIIQIVAMNDSKDATKIITSRGALK